MSKLVAMTSKLDIKMIGATLVLIVCVSFTAWGAEEMEIKRLTTVIVTDKVDNCATFWTEHFGFEQTMAVPAQQPGETGNQFAAVVNGNHELMFQSFKSSEDDLPGAFALADPASFMLYLEVADLDAAIERMKGLEPAVSRRTTFYGSNEIGYRDPCGTLVVLAEFPKTSEQDPEGADAP